MTETEIENKEDVAFEIYQDLVDLPLSKFISCICDDNLQALVISGKPPEETLVSVWRDLMQQYAELLGGGEGKLLLSLYKQINKLSVNLTMIYTLLSYLQDVYVKEFLDQPNKIMFTSFTLDVNDPESYNRILKRFSDRSKAVETELKIRMASYQEIQKQNEGKEAKVDKKYFTSVLISLSDFSKYPIHAEQITVYEYCERINRISEHLSQLKNNTSGSRR